MTPSRVRVAAAQIASVPGDIAANLALHRAMITEAQSAGIDLVVFPELSLTGYETRPDTAALAQSHDWHELLALAELAQSTVVVAGFIERGEDGRVHNAAAVLGGGVILHVHRKLNLPTYGALVETHHYAPGDALDLAETAAGRLACLICADAWNPALPWLAALTGAHLMAVPVASARGAVAADFDSGEGWMVNLRHTALTYGVPVIMANQCGRAGGHDFWGGSMVIDAFGTVLAEAGGRPELLVAKLDPADGIAARARLPTIRDAAPAFVRDALDRYLERGRKP